MKALGSLLPLLIAAAILLAGNGLQGTLVALRGAQEGFGTTMIGVLGMAYYAGFMLSCVYSARLIRSFGHVRVFAALAAIASAGSLAMVLYVNVWFWIVMRLAMGLSFAGLLMVVESWIAEAAPKSDRARVLSIYTIIDMCAVTGSQFILPAVGIDGFELFGIMAIMFGISLVPISLTNWSIPNPPEEIQFSLKKVWRISPLALTGVTAIGMTNAAFRLVGPIYGEKIGLDITGIALFITAGVVGGVILQYPLGLLSDRFDRRWILVIATAGASIAGFFMTGLDGSQPNLVYTGALLFGAFAIPLYSLSAAHAMDSAKPGQFVLTSAALLFFYALGATVGPLIASIVIDYFGVRAFFAYTSVVHLALLVATLVRIGVRPAIPASARTKFVYMLRNSPAVFKMAKRKKTKNEKPVDDPNQNRRQDAPHGL